MLIGFGCTVPRILATRTLENRSRSLNYYACFASYVLWSLLQSMFLSSQLFHHLGAISYSGAFIFLILLAGILAKLIRSTILKGEDTPFVMELPPYRIPTLWGVIHHMWQRTLEYVKKAGTIILYISIVIWLASQYPKKNTFEIDKQLQTMTQEQQQEQGITQEIIEYHRAQESLEYSLVGRIDYAIEPIFRPMGLMEKLPQP